VITECNVHSQSPVHPNEQDIVSSGMMMLIKHPNLKQNFIYLCDVLIRCVVHRHIKRCILQCIDWSLQP